MGGRGGSSIPRANDSKLNPAYAVALKRAKIEIAKEDKAEKEKIKLIKQDYAQRERYKKLNAQWKRKVMESSILARSGNLAEADKVYEEGRKIFESIPEEYVDKF